MEQAKLVILCGGSGSRLWPLSRSNHPKPFIHFSDTVSLFQNTVQRASAFCTAPLVVCGEAHQFLARNQLDEIGVKNYELILEPSGKNTAPAAALAAFYLRSSGQDPLMLISPADQAIGDLAHYQAAMALAFTNADAFTIFGCTPSSAHTGYGYIQAGKELKPGVFCVERFIEKPILADAEHFIRDKKFFWNSGIFVCRASHYCELLKKFAPAIYSACHDAITERHHNHPFIYPGKKFFSLCPSDSIDYAIAEKIQKPVMIALDANWSDVGSWQALHDMQSVDQNGNATQGKVLAKSTKNTYINAQSRFVVAVGVENLAIIETRDAVLVLNKNDDQALKTVVKNLEEKNCIETKLPSCVHRPWGTYECLEQNTHFLVKQIKVKPREQLSLQLHNHRSEHWIIVNGTASVTCGEQVFELKQNQSTYIPLKTKHRLCNNTDEILELIEVQCGDLLSEEDIVRFDDMYGRETNKKMETMT